MISRSDLRKPSALPAPCVSRHVKAGMRARGYSLDPELLAEGHQVGLLPLVKPERRHDGAGLAVEALDGESLART